VIIRKVRDIIFPLRQGRHIQTGDMSSHIVRHIRTAHKEKALKSLPSQKPATPSEELGMSAGHFSQILGGRSRFLRREALERFLPLSFRC
ncbi:hypothetical protein ABMX48_36455, partial [Streptomyces cavourensis]